MTPNQDEGRQIGGISLVAPTAGLHPLTSHPVTTDGQPVLPDYQGGCISNVVPELIKQVNGIPAAAWVPSAVSGAKQIVLLVLDGLGWQQLQEHKAMAPTLTSF